MFTDVYRRTWWECLTLRRSRKLLRIELDQGNKPVWANVMVFVLGEDGEKLGCWRQEKEGWGRMVLEFEIPPGLMEEPNNWLG